VKYTRYFGIFKYIFGINPRSPQCGRNVKGKFYSYLQGNKQVNNCQKVIWNLTLVQKCAQLKESKVISIKKGTLIAQNTISEF